MLVSRIVAERIVPAPAGFRFEHLTTGEQVPLLDVARAGAYDHSEAFRRSSDDLDQAGVERTRRPQAESTLAASGLSPERPRRITPSPGLLPAWEGPGSFRSATLRHMIEMEQWERDVLDQYVELLPKDTSRDDAYGILVSLVRQSGEPLTVQEATRRFLTGAPGDLEEYPLRMFHLGTLIGRYQEAEKARQSSEERPGLLDPDAFAELAREFDTFPDLRRLHAYAKAAILAAIQRLAESATDVADVASLADAYMTLPSPNEDEPG